MDSKLNITAQAKVFQNHLVLSTVFSTLPVKNLLPLRQVSHIWKEIIDKIISKNIPIKIHPTSTGLSDYCINTLLKDLIYIERLKLSNLNWNWSSLSYYNLTPIFYLRDIAGQIETLNFTNLVLSKETEFIIFETIVSLFPNLKKLDVTLKSLSTSTFLQFHPKIFEKLELILFKTVTKYEEISDPGKVVSHCLKIFQNLRKAFGNVFLDSALLKHLVRKGGKEGLLFVTRANLPLSETCRPLQAKTSLKASLELLGEKELPNLKSVSISVDFSVESFVELFENTLKKIAPSLETLNLSVQPPNIVNLFKKRFILNIPPLPKLRTLRVTIPPAIVDGTGTPCFIWNFGNSIAKDFPSLVKLEFGDVGDFPQVKWEDYKLPESWEIWEPILPIVGKGGANLTPPPTLEHVKIDIPRQWIGEKENVFWGKWFLQIYTTLYGKVDTQLLSPSLEKWNEWMVK